MAVSALWIAIVDAFPAANSLLILLVFMLLALLNLSLMGRRCAVWIQVATGETKGPSPTRWSPTWLKQTSDGFKNRLESDADRERFSRFWEDTFYSLFVSVVIPVGIVSVTAIVKSALHSLNVTPEQQILVMAIAAGLAGLAARLASRGFTAFPMLVVTVAAEESEPA